MYVGGEGAGRHCQKWAKLLDDTWSVQPVWTGAGEQFLQHGVCKRCVYEREGHVHDAKHPGTRADLPLLVAASMPMPSITGSMRLSLAQQL